MAIIALPRHMNRNARQVRRYKTELNSVVPAWRAQRASRSCWKQNLDCVGWIFVLRDFKWHNSEQKVETSAHSTESKGDEWPILLRYVPFLTTEDKNKEMGNCLKKSQSERCNKIPACDGVRQRQSIWEVDEYRQYLIWKQVATHLV
jgi:hypothetical protein